MKRRDYLPETVIDVTADEVNQRVRAIAAAELAYSLGRKSPCLRGISREYRQFCLEQFQALQEG
jgi:hypothetical protein